MSNNNPKKVWKWLKTMPSLSELCEKYPEEWTIVQRDISTAYQRSRSEEQSPARLNRSSNSAMTLPKPAPKPARGKPRAGKALDPTLSQYIRNRMAQMAIKNYGLIAASGIKKGVVRFNWLNGFIIKALLFARELERKPVPLFWFRLMWPLVWQKNRLMPLAEPEGIYCFYSRQLIEKLAVLIGSRSCLEIAAGDGTLARFLKNHGVRITATDNCSWKYAVHYPDSVVKRDAREALKAYAPEAVICSWPPADNDFERRVFKTRSVQIYIVIGSRHKFATGNWDDYERQSAFTLEEEEALSRLVLPPELGSAVYIFRRKSKCNTKAR
ncbi:MAG: SAM-dependent methyltransferase [Proteobacteria bacterium]|nr:SAM-dependent methyltransferase [Pseudomonadota bacterium]